MNTDAIKNDFLCFYYGKFDYSFHQGKTVYAFQVRWIVYTYYQGKTVYAFQIYMYSV